MSKQKKLQINILVLGKTGVGKSALINYLYGEPIRKSKSGAPVTDYDISKTTCSFKNGLEVNLYDTPGIEADKHDMWHSSIMNEIKRRDVCDVQDWFHSIFYCINVSSARAEPFELKWVHDITKAGNRVFIVLTKSDKAHDEQKNAIRNRILDANCGVGEQDIIEVISSSKRTLISNIKTDTKGKDEVEEIFNELVNSLWINIVKKLPEILYSQGVDYLDSWKDKAKQEILAQQQQGVEFLNSWKDNAKQEILVQFKHSNLSKNELRKIDESLKMQLKQCWQGIDDSFDKNLNKTISFYNNYLEKHNKKISTNKIQSNILIDKSLTPTNKKRFLTGLAHFGISLGGIALEYVFSRNKSNDEDCENLDDDEDNLSIAEVSSLLASVVKNNIIGSDISKRVDELYKENIEMLLYKRDNLKAELQK
ncbi:MAG: 50S ribosome-binding GTPase [Oscillospiraceae bacterium]|jgi:small GTP-binding protein|nr:50S ribosome-binding GTPase [Oscillospiraceae bacterium]